MTDWKKRPIETYQYSPYGERVVNTRWRGKGHSDSQYGLNFGFTGRYFDEDTDLYYLRARYYDTEQGRFISRDPAGYVDGMSLYNGYFAERFMLDPTGMDTYQQNRQLSLPTAKILDRKLNAVENPLSHTFVYTTDEKGDLKHTYSWGNEYDKDKNGIWFKDRDEDVEAAKESIEQRKAMEAEKSWWKKLWMKDNFEEPEGDSNLDKFIEEAFNELQNDKSKKHPWKLFNNCKHEADALCKLAKQKQEEARKKEEEKKKKPNNSPNKGKGEKGC